VSRTVMIMRMLIKGFIDGEIGCIDFSIWSNELLYNRNIVSDKVCIWIRKKCGCLAELVW